MRADLGAKFAIGRARTQEMHRIATRSPSCTQNPPVDGKTGLPNRPKTGPAGATPSETGARTPWRPRSMDKTGPRPEQKGGRRWQDSASRHHHRLAGTPRSGHRPVRAVKTARPRKPARGGKIARQHPTAPVDGKPAETGAKQRRRWREHASRHHQRPAGTATRWPPANWMGGRSSRCRYSRGAHPTFVTSTRVSGHSADPATGRSYGRGCRRSQLDHLSSLEPEMYTVRVRGRHETGSDEVLS